MVPGAETDQVDKAMRTVHPAPISIPASALAACLAALVLQPPAGYAQGLEKLGPRFDLDLDSYRRTDPSRVTHREVETVPVPVETPRALAIGEDDTLYAAGAGEAVALSGRRKPVARWTLPAPATALATGPGGRVYVAAGGAVYLLPPGQSEPAPWTDLGERAVITSIAASSNRVFLADAGNRVVAAFDTDARLLRFIGRKNKAKGIPGLVIPSPYFDVALAEDGGVWLANTGRLLVAHYAEDGARKATWGESGMNAEGFCGCCNPIHLARLPDGRFVTSEKGIARVKIYHANGTFSGVVTGAERFEDEEDGLDLAVDAGGRVYVLDSMRSLIRVYEQKGSDGT